MLFNFLGQWELMFIVMQARTPRVGVARDDDGVRARCQAGSRRRGGTAGVQYMSKTKKKKVGHAVQVLRGTNFRVNEIIPRSFK